MTPADTTQDTVLILKRTFPVPVAKVYTAWTSAEALRHWLAPADYLVTLSEADFRVGGSYRVSMKPPHKDITHTVNGTYREIVPEEKLVFTWQWEDDADDAGETLVTVQFEDNGAETALLLTHELFPNAEARDKHAQGWESCLGNLDTHCK